MPAALLLVTPAELTAWQRGALPVLDEQEPLAERAIATAQGVLESVLGYNPLVHLTRRVRLGWRAPDLTGLPYLHAVGAGAPAVQVATAPYVPAGESAGYYSVTVGDDGRTLEVALGAPLPDVADLYEGWRGSHHLVGTAGENQADLRTLPGLAALTATPPLLPEALRTAICEGALYIARRADRAGRMSSTIDLGKLIKTTETLAPMNDARDELGALMAVYAHPYRRFLV